MRTLEVLQKNLSGSLQGMQALRRRVLQQAVQSLIQGRRLILTDIARSWPDAQYMSAPLKAFDRLLSNQHLQAERETIYADMARWLLRSARPVLLVDWSELKSDRSWCLLRAAVPVGGRALPVLDMVFPGAELGSRRAECLFLQRLKALVPASVTPVLVTDAGYRSPWFKQVRALGWHWLGRLRGRTCLKLAQGPQAEPSWVPCHQLYPQAQNRAQELAVSHINRSQPLAARCVLYRAPLQGRKDRTRRGHVARNKLSRQCARRQREPWLIVASESLADLSAGQLVNLYKRRMQIESSFRDLKSHQYGQGLEDSLTRSGARLSILLLISAMACFACWLIGLACRALGVDHRVGAKHQSRRYSTIYIGRQALADRWPLHAASAWITQLRCSPLPPYVAVQMSIDQW